MDSQCRGKKNIYRFLVPSPRWGEAKKRGTFLYSVQTEGINQIALSLTSP